MFCSKCGLENPATSSYCAKCGMRLINSVEGIEAVRTINPRSVMRITGSILAMVASLIAICPLTLDVLIAGVTWAGAGNNDMEMWGQNLSNMTTSRIGLVIVAVFFCIIILSIRKPSIILSLLLTVSMVGAIFLPWLMKGNSQSIGGAFGFGFLVVGSIGAILLLVDSIIYLVKIRRIVPQ